MAGKRPRFDSIGLHPDFIGSSIASRRLKTSPYSYTPYYILLTNPKGTWSKSLRDQELKQKLRATNPIINARERLKVEVRCPGDIDNLDGVGDTKNVHKDSGFGTRFAKKFESLTPGPGTYGKNHVPDQLYHEKKGPFLTFSTRNEFERDGLIGRNTCPKSTLLPPNLYCPIDQNSIAVRLINKKISKRGPYDLFTGPRVDKNNKNYFGQKYITQTYCQKTFYPKVSELDELLTHPRNAKKGKFFKSPRFKLMVTTFDGFDEDQFIIKPSPNPTTYDPVYPRATYKDKGKKYPFNSSNMNVRPNTFDPNLPGPGRYVSSIHRKPKNSWPFVTTYRRGHQPPKPYNNF